MMTRFADALQRPAAAVSRRGSLRVLGGAALTSAFAAPTVAVAGKAGKKARKRCKRQRGQCLASIEKFCQPKADPNACESLFTPCCEHFAACSAAKGIECLFTED